MWRLWSKALGEKATECDKESDRVAIIRTVLIIQSIITNTFIIANAIRHWNQHMHKPALVIPGFITNDIATTLLRHGLNNAGYQSYGWNAGINLGANRTTLEMLENRLDAISNGDKVMVVGWSLGGVFARELACRAPDKVSMVVTLGAPLSTEEDHSPMTSILYEMIAGHSVLKLPTGNGLTKPPVPTLTLWSSSDEIIPGESGRGPKGASDHDEDLKCGHMSFGMCPFTVNKVIKAIQSFAQNNH